MERKTDLSRIGITKENIASIRHEELVSWLLPRAIPWFSAPSSRLATRPEWVYSIWPIVEEAAKSKCANVNWPQPIWLF
uniref:hypothetical protein n=1 Tax=Polaromonas sp. H8N TaxID=1840297 RepID=UPI0015E80400|nr:hypothetical protein [Polaromonas sp. H8N]